MKNIWSITIGMICGVSLAMFVIGSDTVVKAEIPEESWWDSMRTETGDLFDWGDIVAGRDIYKAVYSKLNEIPEDEALKNVALSFGLTIEEAEAVVGGSITPIFNQQNRNSSELTQEDAYQIYNQIQEDFADIRELIEIQQEIEVSVAPSEMFSNGDLLDSGFDLVHDLSVMEEILFVDQTKNVVGGVFADELASPLEPLFEEPVIDDSGLLRAEAENDEPEEDEEENESQQLPQDEEEFFAYYESIEAEGSADLSLSDVEELEFDICEEDNLLQEAVTEAEDDFIEEENADSENNESDGNNSENSGNNSNSGSAASSNDEGEEDDEEEENEYGVEPAKAQEWGQMFCPSLAGEGNREDTNAGAGSSFDGIDFGSLGAFENSIVGQVTAAGFTVNNSGISINAGICIDSEVIYETLSTYRAGDSCVACEVERINKNFEETLNHSLVPSKVTGNFGEASKCKESFSPLLDMEFFLIPAPITTPPNDELLLGNNIAVEWNNFVRRYEPFLFEGAGRTNVDTITEFELSKLEDSQNSQAILQSVLNIRNRETAEALREIENFRVAAEGNNNMEYSQAILAEMKQMTEFFRFYLESYERISNEICPQILDKDYIES